MLKKNLTILEFNMEPKNNRLINKNNNNKFWKMILNYILKLKSLIKKLLKTQTGAMKYKWV